MSSPNNGPTGAEPKGTPPTPEQTVVFSSDTADQTPSSEMTIGYTPPPSTDNADSSQHTIGYTPSPEGSIVLPSSTGVFSQSALNLGAHSSAPPPGSSTPRSFFSRSQQQSARLSIQQTFAKTILTATGGRVTPETLVGPYEIIDELGKGGMGVVYKARHIHLNRIVALKMIIGGVNIHPAHLERFQKEAEAVAKLNHTNIVQVYDVGEHNGAPYLALELVDGGNLAKKCEGKPQSAKFSAQTVETLSRAVHVAHQAGVIHRDLKPQNVLITLDGQPKVTDFGLAKDIGDGHGASGQTHAGSILGTPSYMAPEQAAGRVQDIGPATDVYALGCILYEMLVGHPPFRAESPIATIRLVLDGEVVAPRAILPSISRDLDTICLKALEKPPHRRYQSAESLAEDLRRHLDGEPILARPVGRVERVSKWVKRNPARATALGAIVVFSIAFLLLGIWSYITITKRARDAEEAHATARKNLYESTRRMIRLNVSNGTKLLDTFDYLGAPLWFAEALRLESEELGEEPDFKDRERMHRIRLRAVFDHLPRMSNIWLHEVALTEARYDAEGRFVMSASEDGIARVWRTDSGEAFGPPLEHGSPIRSLAITSQAKLGVTSGQDGVLRLWRPSDGSLIRTSSKGAVVLKMVVCEPLNLLLAGSEDGRVRAWNLQTGEDRFWQSFQSAVTDIQISPDGQFAAVSSREGLARVFDLKTGTPLNQPLKHRGEITKVTFTPDSKFILTSSADTTAIVWELANGQQAYAPLKHPREVNAVAVSADGQRIVTACQDSSAKIWDFATGQPVGRSISHEGPVRLVTISPDGRWAATASEDNSIRVWDIATGEPQAPPLRHNAVAVSLAFAPNGHELLVADQTRAVRVWTLIRNGDVAGTAPAHSPALKLAPPPARNDVMQTVTSSDGKLAITFGGGQAVRVRKTDDHEPQTPPLRTGAPVVAAAFNTDGKILVTGDQDGTVMAWSTEDGKPQWALPAKHVSKVLRVVFNPAGDQILTTSDDNTARIWNLLDGSPRISPVRLGVSVHTVEFDPSGKLFYTAFPNGSARVWDTTTGEPLTPRFPARKDWLAGLDHAKWPTEAMLAAGRMLSGQRLSPSGDILPTDAVSLREDWAGLKAKYEIVSVTKPEVLKGWRERIVSQCLQREQWFAAGWHLDRLIHDWPENADYRVQRADVSTKLGDWKQAAESSYRAILLEPGKPESWYTRGKALGQLNEWEEAAAHLNKAIQLKSDRNASLGLLPKMRLLDNNLTGYRAACRDLIQLHRDEEDVQEARAVAWACVLSVEASVDQTILLKLVELVVKATPNDSGAVVLQALTLHRLGRESPSMDKLRAICEVREPNPTAWLVYSMQLSRAGQTDDAKLWRSKAEEWHKQQNTPGSTPATWDLRTDVQLLLREMQTAP